MKELVNKRFTQEFGAPTRDVVKVKSWDLNREVGVVLQVDQPTRKDAAYVWLPCPGDGQPVPDIAVEYPAEAGRHSGTYPASGLKRGEPALKLTVRNSLELDDVVFYLQALTCQSRLPAFRKAILVTNLPSISATLIDPDLMPATAPLRSRCEAIPRLVQREVWQRDGGECTECKTRERLCFDHIVPFSRGGGNSIRNLQLLCESCNLRKSNGI